jgi:hypothetical protein
MEVAEGNYTATSFIAEFIESIRGGGARIIAIVQQNHGQTHDDQDGEHV